jgi:hypothetical protein
VFFIVDIPLVNSGFGNVIVIDKKTKLTVIGLFVVRGAYFLGTGYRRKEQRKGQNGKNQGSAHKLRVKG